VDARTARTADTAACRDNSSSDRRQHRAREQRAVAGTPHTRVAEADRRVLLRPPEAPEPPSGRAMRRSR